MIKFIFLSLISVMLLVGCESDATAPEETVDEAQAAAIEIVVEEATAEEATEEATEEAVAEDASEETTDEASVEEAEAPAA